MLDRNEPGRPRHVSAAPTHTQHEVGLASPPHFPPAHWLLKPRETSYPRIGLANRSSDNIVAGTIESLWLSAKEGRIVAGMQDLIEELRRFRDERDWGQFHTEKDLAISVSVEAAELLELFQWRPASALPDAGLVEAARGEMADVVLYLILLADKLNVDLLAAAQEKLEINKRRFPVSSAYGVAKPLKGE